jgi:hypothetical protein
VRVAGELAFCVDEFSFEDEVFVEDAADVVFEGFYAQGLGLVFTGGN